MYELVMPHINKFGAGCIKEIGSLAKSKDLKKGIIITDRNLTKLGFDSIISGILNKEEIESVVYDGVEPNPTLDNVKEAITLYNEEKCDFIIGLGGGSANDCSKAVSVLATNEGKLEDFVELNKSINPGALIFSVNTTAGTASEISRAFLISDTINQEKLIFKDINALPYASFNDSDLMMGLPKSITAMTGMDALTHALETYVSNGKYRLTQELALSAIGLVFESLELVCENLDSRKDRDNMIYAQSLAGMAFCNSGVGLVHAMAHPLGAVYNLPHGLCNAILLPFVMDYNKKVCMEEYAEIARRTFPIDTQELDDVKACDYLIEQVRILSNTIGTLQPLRSLNVKEEDFSLLADKVLVEGNIGRNPIMPTKEDVIVILRNAF